MEEKTKLSVIRVFCIISLLITVFSIQRTYARYFEKVDTNYNTQIKRWVVKVNNSIIHNKSSLNEVMQPVFIENAHMNSNNTLVPGREGYFEFEIDYSTVDVPFKFQFDIKQLNTKTVITGEEPDLIETIVDNHLEDFEVYGYQIIDGGNADTTDITSLAKIDPIIDVDQGKITYTKIVTATETELATLQVQRVLEDFGDGTKKVEITSTKALDTDKKVEVRVLFRWNDTNKDTAEDDNQPGMNNKEDTQYDGESNTDDPFHDLLKYNVKITFTQKL